MLRYGQVLSGTNRHAQERSKTLYFIHNSTVFKSPNSPVSPKSPVGPMETTPGLFTYEVMGAKSKNLGPHIIRPYTRRKRRTVL